MDAIAERKTLVVVLDDLHWSDAASIEVLAALLRRGTGARVLLALGYPLRQGAREAQLSARRAHGHDHRARAVERAGVLAARSASTSMRSSGRRSTPQSGGNPFYTLQLAHASKLPSRSSSGDRLALDAGVPRVVAAALVAELEALTADARVLLSAGAIAGDPFEPELAYAIAELSPDAGVTALDELLDERLLRATEVPRRFAFRHPLVRRAVYASTKGGWRLAAHARAAQTLAAQGASASARAHHVEHSGVRGERAAIELLLEAGDADAPRAPAGAAGRYAAALRLMPEEDRPARLRTLMKLAQMQQSTGDLARCHATLLEAIELVPGDDLALRLRLTSACAACENFLGRHEPAERRLVAALNSLPDQGSREAVAVLLDLATGAFFTLELERMCDMARRGLAAARALGEPALVGAAAAVLAHGCATAGLVAEASSNADEAGACLDDLPDDTLALYLDSVSRLAWAEYLIERFDDSIRHAARGAAVARATGQGQFAQLILSAQGLSTAIRGDLSAATALQEEAIETAELAANDYLTSGVLTATANIAMATGDLERARRVAERSVACVADLEGGHLAAMARVRLAVTLRELGASVADTEELVASAGGWELPLIPPTWRVAYKEAIARVELEGGRLDQAARLRRVGRECRRRARSAAGDGRGPARPRPRAARRRAGGRRRRFGARLRRPRPSEPARPSRRRARACWPARRWQPQATAGGPSPCCAARSVTLMPAARCATARRRAARCDSSAPEPSPADRPAPPAAASSRSHGASTRSRRW